MIRHAVATKYRKATPYSQVEKKNMSQACRKLGFAFFRHAEISSVNLEKGKTYIQGQRRKRLKDQWPSSLHTELVGLPPWLAWGSLHPMP